MANTTPENFNASVMVNQDGKIVYPETLTADTITSENINSTGITTETLTADTITSENINSTGITTETLTADTITSQNIPSLDSVQTLQTEKANKGNLYFNNGRIRAVPPFPAMFPFSVCMRVKMQSFPTDSQTLFTFANYPTLVICAYITNTNVLRLRIASGASGSLESNDKTITLNNNFLETKNDIVFIFKNLNTFDLYINGVLQELSGSSFPLDSIQLGLTSAFAINTNDPNYSTNPASTNPIELSDVAVFNFDMSASDAPYSVSDFSSGKAIPPVAQKGFGLLNPTVGTSNGQISQAFNTGIVSIAQSGTTLTATATGTSGETASRIYCAIDPTKPIYISNSNITINNNISFRARIYYTDGTNKTTGNLQSGVSVTLTPDATKTINYLALLYLGYNATAGDATISDFCVQQNGALLALENYTITVGSTQYVPDVSGNNYDATVSGSVAGTNDIAIAKLADLINQRGA